MKMSKACDALDTCNISPVRPKLKHTSTPVRTRRKTSRREQGVDVHTTNACSTPSVQLSPRLSRSSQNSPRFKSPSHFNSPSCSIPSSQDNQPDVVWDYNSPKLSRGGRKKELKITVQEFLENLSQCQSSECNSQSGTYMKLLDNWMAKPAVPAEKKKALDNKKLLKKRSRQRLEELKNCIELIQRSKTDIDKASVSRLQEYSENEQATGGKAKNSALESNNSFKNSFIEGGSTDDSSEDLWGDMDNSFIVKATQELDKISVIPANTTKKADEVLSTIPDTVPSPKFSKSQSPIVEKERHCEKHSDLLLHLSNIDWEDDDDEWDRGFLVEDDDLSLIPEDILSGKSVEPKEETKSVPQKSTTRNQNSKFVEINTLVGVSKGMTAKKSESSFNKGMTTKKSENSFNKGMTAKKSESSFNKGMTGKRPESSFNKGMAAKKSESSFNKGMTAKKSESSFNKGMTAKMSESSFDLKETEFSFMSKVIPTFELDNSFEDDSFEDESLLCQPEVLSRIDEVESMLSQPKCTPEEIKKKKEEAIKRRKNTHFRKKN